MITQVQQITIDSIDTTYKTISLKIVTIVLNDNVEIARSEPWRRAFFPGQIEEVKSVTGWTNESPEIIYLNSIWTQEVIDAYNNSQQGA